MNIITRNLSFVLRLCVWLRLIWESGLFTYLVEEVATHKAIDDRGIIFSPNGVISIGGGLYRG